MLERRQHSSSDSDVLPSEVEGEPAENLLQIDDQHSSTPSPPALSSSNSFSEESVNGEFSSVPPEDSNEGDMEEVVPNVSNEELVRNEEEVTNEEEVQNEVGNELLEQESVIEPSSSGNEDEGAQDVTEENLSVYDIAVRWLLCQNGNHCSNRVADNFFRLATDLSKDFERLKSEGSIPTMTHLRKVINDNLIDGILMDFKYHNLSLPEEDREANATYVMNVTSQPRKEYPPDKFQLIWQVTKVNVSIFVGFMF